MPTSPGGSDRPLSGEDAGLLESGPAFHRIGRELRRAEVDEQPTAHFGCEGRIAVGKLQRLAVPAGGVGQGQRLLGGIAGSPAVVDRLGCIGGTGRRLPVSSELGEATRLLCSSLPSPSSASATRRWRR